MKDRVQIGVLVLLALVLGCLLGRSAVLPGAHAQSEAAAGRVAVVMGQERQGNAPIVVVDSLDQTVVVYNWSYSARDLELKSARTYRFDKQLRDFNTKAPSHRQVQDMLRREGR